MIQLQLSQSGSFLVAEHFLPHEVTSLVFIVSIFEQRPPRPSLQVDGDEEDLDLVRGLAHRLVL